MSVWAWLVSPAEQNATSRPADAVLAELPDSDSNLSAGLPVTYQGKTWIVYSPVYPTKAAAQASPSGGGGGPTVPGIPGLQDVPNPFAGITDVAHAIAAIGAFFVDAWKQITNWRMWASLGWLIVGLALIEIGIRIWLGQDVLRRIGPPGLPVEGI